MYQVPGTGTGYLPYQVLAFGMMQEISVIFMRIRFAEEKSQFLSEMLNVGSKFSFKKKLSYSLR